MLFGALIAVGVLVQLYAGLMAVVLAIAAGHGIDGTRFMYPGAAVLTFLVVFFLWPIMVALFLAFAVIAVPIGFIAELIKKSS